VTRPWGQNLLHHRGAELEKKEKRVESLPLVRKEEVIRPAVECIENVSRTKQVDGGSDGRGGNRGARTY